jgi:WD40 repeat protein
MIAMVVVAGGGFGGNGGKTDCSNYLAAFSDSGGGGGGLFADANGGDGGNNPNSAPNGIDGSFGQGGGGENNGNGGVGGDFGGGAGSCAGAGADGGFGGGGASATDYVMGAVTPQSGKGGIFGGGGGGSYSNVGGQFAGDGQTKGGGGGGAGLGGAIFVRKAGKLTVIGSTLIGSTFKNNSANGGTGTDGGGDGQGKGGAIFVQEGATVIVEGKLTFEGNTAEDDEGSTSTTDNDDVYGIITPTVKITASGGNPTEEKQTSADFTFSRAMGYEESTVYFFITGTATFNNDYTIENATTFDGISGMGTVTIPKNNQETSIKLKITPKDDDFVDPNETISITLYPGTSYKMSETEKTATLVIKDNDYHQVATALSLETNHAAILDKGGLTISGKLSRFPYDKEKHDLSGEQVTLTVIAPDGTFLAKGEDCPFKKTLTEDEQFIISGLEKEGTFSYTFSDNSSCLTHQAAGGKYTFKASFAGNLKEETGENLLKIPSDNNLEAIEPEVSVLVGPSAGYVLLIQGQIASDPEGSTAYNKTTNRIYQKLIDRGFEEENISYFNFNPEQGGVDGIPERQAIETALSDLKGSFEKSPAPLYIIMVNHGGKEGHFYIDNGNNEKITANDLSDWMNRFEEGLDAAALKQPRIAIIGACYSGSFIKSLSKAPTIDNNSVVDAGRIIITSASAEEESYKGPQEEDGIRSGEFFMEELFQQLGRGESLKTSFEYAVERTETLTHRDDANATEPFYDQAAQHPLLDDNGDRVGSNALFMGQNQDGQIAQNTYLGGGQQDPDEAIVTEVTHTIYLDDSTTTTDDLFAHVNNVNRVSGKEVILNIRPPNFSLPVGDGSGQQVEIDKLDEKQLSCDSSNKCTGSIDGFATEGQYEVYYFVRDTETNNLSPIKQSLVYKDKARNDPPKAFSLQLPKDKDENQQTVVLFNWESSSDVDSKSPVVYNLLLSKDGNFGTEDIVHRQEGLTTTMTYIDKEAKVVRDDGQTGIEDQTTYYWKVQAVDAYGARTNSSEVFSFKTNNTNSPDQIVSVHVSGALEAPIPGDVVFQFFDYDNNPLSDLNPNILQDQGYHQMMLPHGRRRAKIRVAGYEEQEIQLDTTQGTAQLNVKMIPIGGQTGLLQFSNSTYSATESDGTLNLNVSRVEGSEKEISVQYMVSGTATLNTDYTGGTGTLTWGDGDDSDKKITLNLIDDQEVEEIETLNLILFNPIGGATLGNPAQATLTITDNDEAGVASTLQFKTTTQTIEEGKNITLTVTRLYSNQGDVSVQYMATGDSTTTSSDYTGGSGTLSWANGDSSDKSLTIKVTDDEEVEESETIHLTLMSPTGGATLGNPSQTTITITDNDEAKVSGTLQFNTATHTVKEGEEVTLTVTRSQGNQGEVSVQYMTTGDSTATSNDYTGGSGTLTWAASDSGNKSLTLKIIDDNEAENAETIQLILMAPTGGAVLGNPTQTTVTITDNDVALDNQPVATPDPVVTPTPVVTPNPVVTTDPVVVEPDTSVPVTTPVIAPESESETEIAAETGTTESEGVSNASQTAILQFASTTYMAEESEGELHKITVTRTNSSRGEISVQYLTTVASTATYGKDFSGGNGSLTWANGETGAKSIMLTLIADNEVENLETVNLMLSNPTGPARLGPQPQTTLLITDPVVIIEPIPEEDISVQNANAGVLQFFAPYYTINEGMIGDLTTFTVTRTEGDEGEVSVQYTILEEGTATPYQDYVGGIGTLIWQAGDNRPKPISVMVLDDRQIEEWETIPLVLFEPTGGAELGAIKQASLIIADNDQPATVALPQTPAEISQPETSEITELEPATEESTLDQETDESSLADDLEEKEPAQTASQETTLVFSDLPSLGNGMVVLDDGTILNAKILKNHFDTDIRFFGGAKTSGQKDHSSFLTLSSSRQVEISGEIKVEPAHIGKIADLVIVQVLINQTSNTPEQLLMFDNQGQIVEWDGELATLLAAEEAVTLSATQTVAIYRGWLKPGLYQIHFGYRFADDGLIFFNGEQPIQLQVKADDEQYAQKSPIIWHAAFSPDGSQIATASSDGHISLWNANTGNRLARLQGHTDKVKSVAFSPDGQLLATASYDQTAKLWEIKTQQDLSTLRGHQSEVEKAIFSPDGQQIATAGGDGTVHLWTVDTLQEVAILTGHQDGIKQVAFSHDGHQLVTTSWDKTARLWQVETGELIAVLPHQGVVEQAAFSPSDQQVVTTSWDQTAVLWDTHTGQAIHTLTGHRNGVTYAAFSPNGEYLLTTSWDNSARLWEAKTGEPLWVREHQASVYHAAFSPDGQLIITGASDGTAHLWETTTGKPLKTLTGHQGNIWQVSFSPDGQQIITASWDNTVRVWEVESGEVVMVLKD